jgi:hypothetical protein
MLSWNIRVALLSAALFAVLFLLALAAADVMA